MRQRQTGVVFVVLAVAGAMMFAGPLAAQAPAPALPRITGAQAFKQLADDLLSAPNAIRTASGAPGPAYWQQQVDYVISVSIDDETRHLSGTETITYHNNSPETLRYLWLQLDANIFSRHSDSALIATAPDMSNLSLDAVKGILARDRYDGGFNITAVTGESGAALPFTIVKTMMRIDLPWQLESGARFVFKIDWDYAINDCRAVGGRGGYEHFAAENNTLYEMAQWYPRLCAYTDSDGWQHKQFLGRGEFALEFGDFSVSITVPADHIVAATGELQNPADVLTDEQRARLAAAIGADTPSFIVTPEEAAANQKGRATDSKTWVFNAINVRDFAFACSRKFIWDAMGCNIPGRDARVLCMSFFPNEGEPLWSKYSTHAIAKTLEVFSRHVVPYPWPVAISVNGPVGGMEYPMICFNGPRPEADGTYSERTKFALIGVVIHEVGHNWFPMLLNSDERQWTWLDEGLNTFVDFFVEQEWQQDYPSRRGEPRNLVDYMRSANKVPVMTNSESLLQFGNNAYAKPACALNVLRETVLGRDLFDFAFREYGRRWVFKRPTPADLFRTLEDASGIDLDWFWRGWFFGTDPCDIAITGLHRWQLDLGDPDEAAARARAEKAGRTLTLSEERNRELAKLVDARPELKDFYDEHDPLAPTEEARQAYQELLGRLDDSEKALLAELPLLYVADFENVGGLVMPMHIDIHYEDGTKAELRIPAEIWCQDASRVSKLILASKPISRLELDPRQETPDIDVSNNHWPRKTTEERATLTKPAKDRNPMQPQPAK